ncbi:MAG: arylsulfatase [Bacteroidota bacterium]
MLLILFAALLAGCASEVAPSGGEAEAARPNVIVVLVDDMGYSDLGVTGGDVRTPTLDRLAAEGVLMSQFYNTAKCSPSRASLLTGRYSHEAGMGSAIAGPDADRPAGPYQGYLRTDVPTLAELLRTEGYRTYMAGKWHVGEHEDHWPTRRGFDRYFGLIGGATSYYTIRTDQSRIRVMADDSTRWTPPAEGFYFTDAIADSAAAFVARHQTEDADTPFFLYLAFTAPHWPLHAPEEAIAAYAGTYDDGWAALHARRAARLVEAGLLPEVTTTTPQPADVAAWEALSEDERADWARRMEVHAAMMTQMDAGLGRVLDALGDEGDDTLVLFLSDNGASAEGVEGRGLNDPTVPVGAPGSYVAFEEPWAWASVAPFNRYKLNLDEGGIRTPLIAHWPAGMGTGAEGGDARQSATPGHLIDVVPTVLDAAGLAAPDSLPGVSLLAHWRDGEVLPERPLFWEYNGHRAAREGDLKALWRADGDAWSLYDLAADPAEQNDLASARLDDLARLTEQWDVWADRVGVRLSP